MLDNLPKKSKWVVLDNLQKEKNLYKLIAIFFKIANLSLGLIFPQKHFKKIDFLFEF